MDILSAQNKVMVHAQNQVDPLQTKFKSTKELFSYAKKRCMNALNSENPYEHTVVVDTKQNRVLAEYVGTRNVCHTDNIESVIVNPDYTVSFHGHPDSYPLSSPDIEFLLNHNINQEVAIDSEGYFSLAAKRPVKPQKNEFEAAKKNFDKAINDVVIEYCDFEKGLPYKVLCHLCIKHNANGMGLRYITNYPYLKSW